MISQDELRQLKLGKETEQRQMAAGMVDEMANQEMAQVEAEGQIVDQNMNTALYEDAEKIADRLAQMQANGEDPNALLQSLPPSMQQAVMEVVQGGSGIPEEGTQEPTNIEDDTIPMNNEVIASDEDLKSEAMSFDPGNI